MVLEVDKSPPVFVFYHARSTDFEEKIEVCEQANEYTPQVINIWLRDWFSTEGLHNGQLCYHGAS